MVRYICNIWDKINHENIVISNSIILEVMTVLNIKLKVSKELLEKIYIKLNSGKFGIVEDINSYNGTMERMINYLPERLPFFDCLCIELMEQLEISKLVTFDKHFINKGIEIIH
ncbi:MAG: type II toxin-antitoxin system VapC family toxin [Methanobrevibacter sp.]|jgi:predicted nucleic-acid-binding protein|nr:type II toxin-antitoxin system VapC family toxin [Methanobrevibacter sp.]